MKTGLGVLEIGSLGAALVILDEVEKTAPIRLLQAELNDVNGIVLKILGDPAALRVAEERGRAAAARMGVGFVADVIAAPDDRAWKAIESPPEYQPLIEQDAVFRPRDRDPRNPLATSAAQERPMASDPSYAIGLIETQGFTAVIEAIDCACKTANVEVLGKEKLGGGYITILLKGDVAAVRAAVDAGKARVEGLGKLIAAHVIARPSASVLALLPK